MDTRLRFVSALRDSISTIDDLGPGPEKIINILTTYGFLAKKELPFKYGTTKDVTIIWDSNWGLPTKIMLKTIGLAGGIIECSAEVDRGIYLTHPKPENKPVMDLFAEFANTLFKDFDTSTKSSLALDTDILKTLIDSKDIINKENPLLIPYGFICDFSIFSETGNGYPCTPKIVLTIICTRADMIEKIKKQAGCKATALAAEIDKDSQSCRFAWTLWFKTDKFSRFVKNGFDPNFIERVYMMAILAHKLRIFRDHLNNINPRATFAEVISRSEEKDAATITVVTDTNEVTSDPGQEATTQ